MFKKKLKYAKIISQENSVEELDTILPNSEEPIELVQDYKLYRLKDCIVILIIVVFCGLFILDISLNISSKNKQQEQEEQQPITEPSKIIKDLPYSHSHLLSPTSLTLSTSQLPLISSTLSASFTPAPSQRVVPIYYDGKLWWDGNYNTFPEPITAEFSGPPSPEAKGRYAYAVMVSAFGREDDEYCCLGLTLLTSIQQTNPDPNIDRLVILLISDNDNRYKSYKEGTELFDNLKPVDIIGEMFYKAFIDAGANKWVIWKEIDTRDKDLSGPWKQAFSKLKVWSLVQYEKILYLDADTMVLKNIDHLFAEKEFTSAASWDGSNANSPLRPSGGFWVVQPSLKTWGLIQEYLKGRDPCAHGWRLGDMTLTRVLFLNVSGMRYGDETTWQQYDGDNFRWGRCALTHYYPARVDFATTDPRYNLPDGELIPGDRWNMLNESYDILVPICAEPAFVQRAKDRYNLMRRGMEIFDRPDAFSVHFTCGRFKPSCKRQEAQLNTLPPCARDMYEQWYTKLKVYYRPST